MPRRTAFASLFCALIVLTACSGSSTTPDAAPSATSSVVPVAFARTQVRIDAASGAPPTINVEVAANEEQRQRGLGYRDALAPDAGMIFDLGSTRVPSFWMKGMRFALDMIWIDADQRVIGMEKNVQPQPGVPDEQLRRYSADAPVRYVLELNAGASADLGLVDGVRLAFQLP